MMNKANRDPDSKTLDALMDAHQRALAAGDADMAERYYARMQRVLDRMQARGPRPVIAALDKRERIR